MQHNEINLIIVNNNHTLKLTDKVTNKIGTYTKTMLTKRHNIPFYVTIPLSTIDWTLKSGFAIPIEERHEHEVLGAWGAVTNPKSEIRPVLRSPSSEASLRRVDSTAEGGNPKSGRRGYVRVANPNSGERNPG